MRSRPSTALLAGLAIGLGGLTGAKAEPSEDRQDELMHRLLHDCGSCHGMTLKGGLGPALLPDAIARSTDDALIDTIIHGRPGTPMPPWEGEITRAEAAWLVARLRRGPANDR